MTHPNLEAAVIGRDFRVSGEQAARQCGLGGKRGPQHLIIAIPPSQPQETRSLCKIWVCGGGGVATEEPLWLPTVYLLGTMATGNWSPWQPHY